MSTAHMLEEGRDVLGGFRIKGVLEARHLRDGLPCTTGQHGALGPSSSTYTPTCSTVSTATSSSGALTSSCAPPRASITRISSLCIPRERSTTCPPWPWSTWPGRRSRSIWTARARSASRPSGSSLGRSPTRCVRCIRPGSYTAISPPETSSSANKVRRPSSRSSTSAWHSSDGQASHTMGPIGTPQFLAARDGQWQGRAAARHLLARPAHVLGRPPAAPTSPMISGHLSCCASCSCSRAASHLPPYVCSLEPNTQRLVERCLRVDPAARPHRSGGSPNHSASARPPRAANSSPWVAAHAQARGRPTRRARGSCGWNSNSMASQVSPVCSARGASTSRPCP